MGITDSLKSAGKATVGTTIETKKLVTEIKKVRSLSKIQGIYITKDELAEFVTVNLTADKLICWIPPYNKKTWKVDKVYNTIDYRRKVVQPLVILVEDFPQTVDASNLPSDLGRLCSNIMAEVTMSKFVSEAMGSPDDTQKKYILAVGFILGFFLSFAIIMFMMRYALG